MKQKLLLVLVVSVLITAPALAGRADVSNADDATFGAVVSGGTLTDDGQSNTGFTFRLSVEVRSMDEISGGGPTGNTIYTYVYQVWHTSTSPLVLTTIFDMDFNDALNSGSVGINHLQADPDFTEGKLRFQFNANANWDGVSATNPDDALIVYAQSYLGYVKGVISAGEDFDLFGSVNPGDNVAYANTLGPGDSGTGSGLTPTPEPGSLILLTSGLLSGGYLRFKKRKEN